MVHVEVMTRYAEARANQKSSPRAGRRAKESPEWEFDRDDVKSVEFAIWCVSIHQLQALSVVRHEL